MLKSLRMILYVDAASCLGMAVALLLGTGLLASAFGLPGPLLFAAGIVLLPVATLMLLTGRMRNPHRALVLLIVIGNAAWALASLALALGLGVSPTTLGRVFLVAQALLVALLAWAEWSAAG